jgi:prepilin-type N-terminal cleavage/methylation domain-containing protein
MRLSCYYESRFIYFRGYVVKKPADSRGFTLVELMIVIAIIGILAAIALIGSSIYRTKAKVAEATSDLGMIYKAMAMLETDTQQWPGHQTINQINQGGGNEVWDLSVGAAGLVSTDGNFPDWDGPYLPSMPKDPWGNNYFLDTDYQISGVNEIVLGSFGPNEVGQNLYDDDDVIMIIH